jgi:hypothetical protein
MREQVQTRRRFIEIKGTFIMQTANCRERFEQAVRTLAEEKGRIKERLLIAYASQLSLIDPPADVPEEFLTDFYLLKKALSDAEMPYGEGERAADKVETMSEDEASATAGEIVSFFLRLCGSELSRTAAR